MEIIRNSSKVFIVALLLYLIGITYYAVTLSSRLDQRDVTVAMWEDKAKQYEENYRSSVSSCLATSQLITEQDKIKELKIKSSQVKVQERLKDIVYSEVKPNDTVVKEVPATGVTVVNPSFIRMLNTAYCSKSQDAQCDSTETHRQSKAAAD